MREDATMPNLTQDKLHKTKELGILPTDIRSDMIARSGYPCGRGMPGADRDAVLVQYLTDQYFDACQTNQTIPTLTGYLEHMQITWDAWRDIKKLNYPYCRVLKKSLIRLAIPYEQALLGKTQSVGAIFWLKSVLGWQDNELPSVNNASVTISLKMPSDLPPIEPATVRTTAAAVDD